MTAILNRGVRYMKICVEWMEVCSAHLSHIERRTMENDYQAHEVARQFCNFLTGVPPGEWGWIVRQCADLAVRAVRNFAKVYK